MEVVHSYLWAPDRVHFFTFFHFNDYFSLMVILWSSLSLVVIRGHLYVVLDEILFASQLFRMTLTFEGQLKTKSWLPHVQQEIFLKIEP